LSEKDKDKSPTENCEAPLLALESDALWGRIGCSFRREQPVAPARMVG
jgi:hypothetical protein